MKSVALIITLFFSLNVFAQQVAKRSLNIEDFAQWESITNSKISENGKCVLYEQNPHKGDGKLVIKNAVGSFVISRGNTTKLDITMEQLLPTVIFEAPEGSEIILDGEKIDLLASKVLKIKPGDHVVRMKLGDYSLSKKFTIDAEKKYKISLFLDILIQEN